MKRVAVATVTTRPLTAKRLTTAPRRITGLYRLSIVSPKEFEVDIGGRVFNTVRTLDVFHEAPMFVDNLENMKAVDLFSDGELARMIQIHPTGGKQLLRFRITAHEVMPERHELERKMKLGEMKTPLVYEGFLKQMRRAFQEVDPISLKQPQHRSLANVLTAALLFPLEVSAVLLLAKTSQGSLSTAEVIATCDPSRTYINGALFKNLKELSVKVREGRIIGYTYP